MARLTLILTVLTTVIALLGGFRWLIETIREFRWHKRQTGKWLSLLMLCLLPSVSEAACSGSGVTWTCTSGSTPSQVNTALSSASNNATITFDNGSYTWGSDINFVNGQGATLICATVGGCTVTGAGIIGMYAICSGATTDLQRVSGFVFSGGGTRHWWYGSNCNAQKVRIDHNTYSNVSAGSIIMYIGESAAQENFVWGVMDHNTITSSLSTQFLYSLQAGGSNNPSVGILGSSKNMFLEDNTFTNTTMDNNGLPFLDGTAGVAYVARYNSITNNRIGLHGTQHGYGPANLEAYGNTITQNSSSLLDDGERSIHHQGSGTMMVFDNVFDQASGQPHSAGAIALLHSGAGLNRPSGDVCDGNSSVDGNRTPITTYRGYPCKRQPARDVDTLLYPIYVWNNRWADDNSKIDLQCQNDYSANTCPAQIAAERDYFNAVSKDAQTSATSPFNGTTGMGFGTLSNRPTTCTTFAATGQDAPDAGRSGVGYWATDGGRNWNTSNGSGNDGGLYICTATNTWTLWYTPYDYPHPLVSGGGSSPASGGNFVVVLRSGWPLALEIISALSMAWHLRATLLRSLMTMTYLSVMFYRLSVTYTEVHYLKGRELAAKAILMALSAQSRR